ncbi:nephrocystin-4 [Paragonimus westermani]|uniref:Nephrocystin-4 n=1 Tax=Paragonimus westermani TaxID=34504 RepID=A0A5J4NP61_9TREM|nr:nephrocystin-4 [Paragonimus westermani]
MNFIGPYLLCFTDQVVFTLDPNFLRPGEYEQFFNYLLHNNLHLDVWDARSHLLLGTTAIELKPTDNFELQSSLSLQGRLHLRMANVGRRSSKSTAGIDRALELSTIHHYREQKKREQIERMLANVATIVYDLDVSFGCTEFFEFELKNPGSNEDTVHICVEDERNNTFVVTDPREVRVLKTAFGVNTPTEDGLFATDVTGHASATVPAGQGYLSIFLKPNETVRVPFKYMESSMLPTGAIGTNVQYTINFQSARTNHPFSQLLIKVHNYPAVVDQTFRFIQPELSFLKKLVRLPPVNMNVQTGMPSFVQDGTLFANGSSVQLWTRVSDPSVLIESGKASFGESVDLLVKVGLGASPQVREFLTAVYMEPFQLRAAYIWRWVIHALHRVDASATVGQLSAPIGLLLRTDGLLPEGGPRMISIYTSHPDELMLGTELTGQSKRNQGNAGLQFMISPKAVYELKARIMPRQVGMRNYQINVVEATSQRVIRAWIICAEIKAPEVSKTYNIELPLLFRQNTVEMCHKRVAYTNPYSHAKRLRIQTDRPDLLQFKDSEIEVPAGGTAQLALRFIPQPHPSVQRLYVFMKNEDENIEETFAIVAQYT